MKERLHYTGVNSSTIISNSEVLSNASGKSGTDRMNGIWGNMYINPVEMNYWYKRLIFYVKIDCKEPWRTDSSLCLGLRHELCLFPILSNFSRPPCNSSHSLAHLSPKPMHSKAVFLSYPDRVLFYSACPSFSYLVSPVRAAQGLPWGCTTPLQWWGLRSVPAGVGWGIAPTERMKKRK